MHSVHLFRYVGKKPAVRQITSVAGNVGHARMSVKGPDLRRMAGIVMTDSKGWNRRDNLPDRLAAGAWS